MPGLKTVYGRDGTPITDIKAAVVRSSLLNEIGEAIFYVATDSVKCRREVLEFGNYLYIQHGSLPDWVGIIDTPRIWHNGYVEVHAFEVPYILQYRLTPLNTILQGTPGDIFTQLIDIANGEEDTLIRAGNVFMGGVSTPETMTDSVFVHIKKIRENNKLDWICAPSIDLSGRLTIVMDWLEKAGVNTDLELAQGYNILYGDTPLEESGELITSIEALSGNQDAQIIELYEDAETRRTIGLRKIRQSFSGTTETAGLISNAQKFVDENKNPTIATPLTVVDVGSTYLNIRLGNTAKYKYTNVGFSDSGLGTSSLVRIEGYRFDETVGTCELFTGRVS